MSTSSSQSLLNDAIALMHRSAYVSYDRAEALLSALIKRRVRHPPPYVWSAKQHWLRSWRGWSSNTGIDSRRAKELAERALQANPESALALSIRGMIYSDIANDLVAASNCYDAAIAASPGEFLARSFAGRRGLPIAANALESGDAWLRLRLCCAAVDVTGSVARRVQYLSPISAEF